MGDSISDGIVDSYIKSKSSRALTVLSDKGDYVEADELVARIETDKVVVDILAQHSGVITKYFAEVGDTVEVGAEFLEIDTTAKAGSAPAKEATPEPAATAKPAKAGKTKK